MGFLDIKQATKSYGSLRVLHETDISIEEGEFLVLVGPSGCGKSTLLNMIAGLEDISSGEIAIMLSPCMISSLHRKPSLTLNCRGGSIGMRRRKTTLHIRRRPQAHRPHLLRREPSPLPLSHGRPSSCSVMSL